MTKELKECPDCGEVANTSEIEFRGICTECQIEATVNRGRD